MATTLNKIILVGHLSRDPEWRTTATGTAMATFGLATNHRYKAGETWHEETCFLDVVVFGRQAGFVGDALHKGGQVLVACCACPCHPSRRGRAAVDQAVTVLKYTGEPGRGREEHARGVLGLPAWHKTRACLE
jgi:hypothetical protein